MQEPHWIMKKRNHGASCWPRQQDTPRRLLSTQELRSRPGRHTRPASSTAPTCWPETEGLPSPTWTPPSSLPTPCLCPSLYSSLWYIIPPPPILSFLFFSHSIFLIIYAPHQLNFPQSLEQNYWTWLNAKVVAEEGLTQQTVICPTTCLFTSFSILSSHLLKWHYTPS